MAPVSTKQVYDCLPFGKTAAIHGLVLFSSLKNLKLPMRPYEEPADCELTLASSEAAPEELAEKVIELLKQKHILL